MGNLVRTEVNGAIARLHMNRPDKLNALSREMVEEMLAALKQLEGDPAVKAIVLSGKEKHFLQGAILLR